MTTAKKFSGIAVATAAAGFFALAPVSSAFAEDAVKCTGSNSCKGMSACKTASSECKGLNSCKGQGFTMTSTAEACEASGGKVES